MLIDHNSSHKWRLINHIQSKRKVITPSMKNLPFLSCLLLLHLTWILNPLKTAHKQCLKLLQTTKPTAVPPTPSPHTDCTFEPPSPQLDIHDSPSSPIIDPPQPPYSPSQTIRAVQYCPSTFSRQPSPSNSHKMLIRAKTNSIPNPTFHSLSINVSITSDVKEPRTNKEALSKEQWVAAKHEEFHALHTTYTWQIVPCQSNINIVGPRWFFRTKLKADGSVERFKARLTAKNYNQIEGVDFDKTFNPVVKIVIPLLLLQHYTGKLNNLM